MKDIIVEANRALLLSRSQAGIAKYGTTLSGADLTARQLQQHLLEELLDAANYMQALLHCPRVVACWRYKGSAFWRDGPSPDVLDKSDQIERAYL